MNNKVPKRET